VGAFLGAGYAGARGAGRSPVRRYALLALIAAAALALFALLPIGLHSALPLAVLGFIAFAEAVWNTSRVRHLAEPAYQARVQSFTSMAFTLSFPLGSIWGGLAIDRFGVRALLGGAAVLVLIAVGAIFAVRGPATEQTFLEDGT
jgi:predicted MFS family arabinose efflux permease